MTQRNLYDELMGGLEAMALHRQGKITLRTHKIIRQPLTIAPAELKRVREKLNLSQAVFAQYLHTGESTYQNWEQGRARPNAQAVLLIRMVEKNPDTLQTLAAL
ncbi:type II toxin-antitoxin system MqsA family antitoxin [Candidatus Symbiopectobacterium sp. NZEC127]|uniref:helix-turn-helix domain-containing protein n=1 Tax=Candidatus Symbiopectobacterium sp. NZEC127 TaxID=2820472 RepID=UPI0022264F92|nr:type II toxin-antitoxin system MqsA family antitoxin [Candidatus Symbiopectobacterium sp. NZEC127]MCW2487974.1 type II toxin-antitoxin system MqsA family antitoxin [Candidatus Symbiopectobacterium sp. NZEC127]